MLKTVIQSLLKTWKSAKVVSIYGNTNLDLINHSQNIGQCETKLRINKGVNLGIKRFSQTWVDLFENALQMFQQS